MGFYEDPEQVTAKEICNIYELSKIVDALVDRLGLKIIKKTWNPYHGGGHKEENYEIIQSRDETWR